MVYARKCTARITESEWLTPTTLRIRFIPSKKISFKAGQFISVVVPKGRETVKRCYSLSSSPDDSLGYELCVKVIPGGLGSSYLASLKERDEIKIFAPYGHFVLKSQAKRNIVFISTATGVAPFRSMALSQELADLNPKRVIFITGSRSEEEILFKNELESTGFEVVRAVSQPGVGYQGFKGRVTDYLRAQSSQWSWFETDFYVCGNPEMVAEVDSILKSERGVPMQNIHRELFSAPKVPTNVVSIRRPPKKSVAIPIPALIKKWMG